MPCHGSARLGRVAQRPLRKTTPGPSSAARGGGGRQGECGATTHSSSSPDPAASQILNPPDPWHEAVRMGEEAARPVLDLEDPDIETRLVSELKAQGVFDQFRKDCLSDVDTKVRLKNKY